MAVLEIKNLALSFDDVQPLRGVSLSAEPGRITALVGESGSGKSLTSLTVMGLLPKGAQILSGQIPFISKKGAIDLLKMKEGVIQALRGEEIAMIFQNPMTCLNPVFTIGDQIVETILAHRETSKKKALERAIELLHKVGIPEPEERVGQYPHQLSGGMRQRVMIAMALSCEPKVLIADEPTTALDVTIQAQIMQLLKGLARDMKLAVLFITHDLSLVGEYADKVYVMKDGEIVESGVPEVLFATPKEDYTKQLIASLPQFLKFPVEELKDQPVIEVDNLCKTFKLPKKAFWQPAKKFQALKNVFFHVRHKEILGIVGESGSGKSTLAQILMHMIPHDSGLVKVRGKDLKKLTSAQRKLFYQECQMVFQDPDSSLNPRMKIKDILEEPLRVHKLCKKDKIAERVLDMLQRVGLDESALGRYPREFSGGQKQRLAIARALLIQPSILIADEATSALDVTIQKQILELLWELKRDLGFTLIFISHDLSVVEKFCDRVLVFHKGELVEEIQRGEFEYVEQEYTKKLLASSPRLAV